MDPTALPRSIARLQYTAVRLPFAVLDELVVASPWGQGAFVREGFGLFLGSLDRFAGYLLADEQISQRGQALMRRTGHSAKAGAPGTKAPVRPARDERRWPAGPADTRQAVRRAARQGRETGGTIAADQDQDDKRSVRRAADGLVMTGKQRATARSATRAGTVDVRFTLPAEVQADTVALCGEFNDWSTRDIQLERGGDGSWQATVALEPGRSYRYRYLLDGERWENGWHADRYVPNSYGSTDSVVVVE
jgi:hypothetical protein